MTYEDVTLTVQAATVIVAMAGILTALWIAKSDRRAAAAEAQLRWELDLLLRLSAASERGGSQDPEERNRLASEIGALLTALGPERLPLNWQTYRGEDSLAAAAEYNISEKDDPLSLWRRLANEVAIELDRTRKQPGA